MLYYPAYTLKYFVFFVGFSLLLSAVGLLQGCTGQEQINVEEHIQRAKDFRDQGKVKASIIELKNVLQHDLNNTQARWLLGKIYLEVGNGEAAEKELKRARELGVSPAAVNPLLVRAYVFQDKIEKALNEAVVDVRWPKKSQAELLSLRGEALLHQKKLEEAEKIFDKAIQICSQCGDGYLGLASLSQYNNNDDKTRYYIEKARNKDPDNAYVWWRLGSLEQRERHYSEAVKAYNKALELHPQNIPLLLARALAHLQSKEFDAAKEDIRVTRQLAPQHPTLSYVRGLLALKEGRYSDAQSSLESYLKNYPNHGNTLYFLGLAHFAQGHYGQANEHLSRALNLHPESVNTRKLLLAARAKLGEYDSALKVIEPVIDNGSDDPILVRLVGQVYLRAGKPQRGLEYLERAVELAPDSISMHALTGKTLLLQGFAEKASEELDKALTLEPNAQSVQLLQIVSRLQLKAYQEALNLIARMQQDQPENPMPYNLRAAAYLGMEDHDAAEQALSKALQLDPNFIPASNNMARLALRQGDIQTARKYFRKIIQLKPDHLDTLMALGQLDLNANDKDKAIERFRHAMQAHPESTRPYVALAQVYLSQGSYLKALSISRNGLQESPTDPQLLRVSGLAQLGSGEASSAVNTFKQSVSLSPNNAEAWYLLATAWAAVGDVGQIKQNLEKSLAIKPRQVPAKAALARLAYRQDNYKQALELAEELKAEFPENPEGHVVEAEIYVRQNQHTKAKLAYERAMDKVESSSLVREYATAREIAGESQDAARLLNRWLDAHPEDLRARLYLGQLYLRHSKNDLARAEFEKVLKIQPDNVTALNNMAWLLRDNPDSAHRALKYAQKAYRSSSDDPLIADTYGWLLLNNGEVDRGYRLLRDAHRSVPDSATVTYHYAVALNRMERRDEAKSLLQQLVEQERRFSEQNDAARLLRKLSN